MNLNDHLQWRYATKKFNKEKKVSEETLQEILHSVQLSPSSYGLQLFKVLVISNDEVREKLKLVSMGQSQITDASHLIVFCNFTNYDSQQIDDYLELKAQTQSIILKDLEAYGNVMKDNVGAMDADTYKNWTAKQTYIALGNLLTSCATHKVDACPMEGFEVEKYNEILGLSEKGLNAAVIATIGYRSEEDRTKDQAKVRKPMANLFEFHK
ncbi:NAD(P)H-dependent oxidoreductase [Kordia algicida OT-1]|uniref:Nitroreductase domain-containing protein n=1 Tax=Kordia algicida OT-1 TaxID=391587 RepID=A9E908_9FLAO|nr:NAD(P)H-dependent oxidoreductase [Kordia algicida]EDP94842.1 hypothetical protein KAOT1_01410 [Kordia algicida OT-1]